MLAVRDRFQPGRYNLLPLRLEPLSILTPRIAVTRMDDLKQLTQQDAQAFSVGFLRSAGQGRQELHIPDQVGQAELDHNVTFPHITPIRAEAIATQDAFKVLPQNLDQDVTAPMGINVIQHI